MHTDIQILLTRIKILFLPCTLLAALAAFFYLLFIGNVYVKTQPSECKVRKPHYMYIKKHSTYVYPGYFGVELNLHA